MHLSPISVRNRVAAHMHTYKCTHTYMKMIWPNYKVMCYHFGAIFVVSIKTFINNKILIILPLYIDS